ncbi:hypothetical protein ACJ72_06410 [Emergomyces africanus]|uniref:C6 transcription factor n=1 Tax=Emergomyces africanus TaxID=1955775 RepID=A0A1B7NR44_9EURO|nr:hypothetical protein ACJ72_06410 [Emergomyces africanus]
METRIVKNQVVFRFNEGSRPTQQTGGAGGSAKDITVYHARRPHRKSRTGCLNCKKRRVKIDRVLRLDTCTEEAFPMPMRSTTRHRTVEYLHHFITMTAHASSMSDSHRLVMSGRMMQLAFQNPYLMHAVFGVAVTHFRHLLPHDKSYDIAAGIHWQRAIKLYRREISKPIDERNMDPLMSTCMLLSTITFSTEEYKPADSWVFSSDPTRLSWLLGQSGLRCILEAISKGQLQQSIWFEAFQESDDENQTFNNNSPGMEGLHPGLAELCGIDEMTTEDSNPYHWPLRMLSPMLPLKADRGNFAKLITFIGRLEPAYTKLLQEKDPRALLILSYWLGKMCEEKQWWIYPRVSCECFAICMYLEHNEDPRILNLLQYPAERCGYVFDYVLKEMIVQDSNDDVLTYNISSETW